MRRHSPGRLPTSSSSDSIQFIDATSASEHPVPAVLLPRHHRLYPARHRRHKVAFRFFRRCEPGVRCFMPAPSSTSVRVRETTLAPSVLTILITSARDSASQSGQTLPGALKYALSVYPLFSGFWQISTYFSTAASGKPASSSRARPYGPLGSAAPRPVACQSPSPLASLRLRALCQPLSHRFDRPAGERCALPRPLAPSLAVPGHHGW